MVYDGVRDVRHNYVSSLDCDEGDLDSELEEDTCLKREKSQEKSAEKTHIREAVSRMKDEQLDLGPELKTDSPVYWVAVWANPEVRNLLSTQDLGGSQVDGFQEDDAPVEGRRSPVVVNVTLEATAAAGEAGSCRCVARSVWLRAR